jgi:hypothetical protein
MVVPVVYDKGGGVHSSGYLCIDRLTTTEESTTKVYDYGRRLKKERISTKESKIRRWK